MSPRPPEPQPKGRCYRTRMRSPRSQSNRPQRDSSGSIATTCGAVDWRATTCLTHRWSLDRPERLRWWETGRGDDAGADRYWVDGCRRRTPRMHARKCVAPRMGSASTSSGASWTQAESSAMKMRAPRRISRPSTKTPAATMMKSTRKNRNFSTKSLKHLPQGGRQLSWI